MIGLYIFLGLLLLILIALFLSVTVTVKYESEEDYNKGKSIYKISYGPFVILPKNKVKSNKKMRKKKSKLKTQEKNANNQKYSQIDSDYISKNEKSDLSSTSAKDAANSSSYQSKEEKKSDKSEKKKVKTDFALIKQLILAAQKPLIKLLGEIRITTVNIKCIAGGEDAAKTAINYGIYCAAVYSLITWLKEAVRVSVNKVDIKADFESTQTALFISFKIKLRIIAAVVHGIWFLTRFVKG